MYWLLSILSVFNFVTEFKDSNFEYLGYTAKYQNEAYTGMTYQFHPNKQLYKIQFFYDGKQTLTEHRWYDNGVKSTEIEFANGLRHGQHRLWRPDGQVQYLKNFKHEKKHGEFWGWHPNGTVSNYHYFENDKQIIHKTFISDGKPFHNYVFRDEKRVGLDGGQFCKTK